MDYEDNYIQLVDEDGKEFNFEHIMTFDYKEKKYVVLTPVDEDVFEDDDTEDLEALDGATKEDVEKCHCEECHCDECECEDEDEEEGELIILELAQDENGDDTFLSIDDDDLLDELYNVYLQTADSLEDEE